jgi:hypothetical protein
MEYSTRISDLPENITIGQMPSGQGQKQSPPQQQGQTSFALDNGLDLPALPGTYTQMNVHPNPYGQGPPQQGVIPPPQQTFVHKSQTPPQNPYLGNSEQAPHLRMPQHPLPIRDVPQDQTYYQQDEAVKPNYIPAPSNQENYVYDQEARVKRQRRAKRASRFGDWTFDDLVAELQQPIIVAVLFLIFQAPTIHIIMAKYLSFMHLFGEDGDITTTGILFKSVLFGAAYLAFMKFMGYIDA